MNRCPDPKLLEQLLDGQLAASELDAVCQHIEACLGCQIALEELGMARTADCRVSPTLAPPRNDLPIPTEVVQRMACELQEQVDEFSANNSALTSSLKSFRGSAELPDQIADFRIIREIGRGGMGVVCEAEQVSLNRRVALKILTARPGTDAKDIQRFQREARSAARLRHPHIVPVFGNGIDQGYAWYVMQLVTGVSVESFIKQTREAESRSPLSTNAQAKLVSTIQELMHGKVSSDGTQVATSAANNSSFALAIEQQTNASTSDSKSPDTRSSNRDSVTKSSNPSLLGSRSSRNVYFLNVATQIRDASDALAHAHAHGIVHRDIKPSNLMIDDTASIWITDFGLAKSETDLELTKAGNIVGTLRYLAPEQLSGISAPSCDIYSLGATLYEMLTLRPVITASNQSEALEQIRAGEPIAPRKINPGIPIDLETIALKAIARTPGERYRSAVELRDDLQRFIEGKPISARPVSGFERLVRWSRRNPWLAASVAGFLMLLTATAVGSIIAAISFSRLAASEKSSRLAAELAKKIADELATSEREARIEESKQRQFSDAINDFVVDDFLALTSVEGQLSFAGGLNLSTGHNANLSDLLDRAAQKLELRDDLEPRAVGRLNWIIGISYRDVGQLAKSVSYLRRAVEIYESEYGPTSPEFLSAKNSLGVALHANGNWQEAKEIFQFLVDTSESLYGKNENRSLIARYQLIKTEIESGDLKQGLPAMRELAARLEQFLGPDDQFTLLALSQLAHALFSTGEFEESRLRYEEAHSRCAQAYGEKHPDSLRIEAGLAAVLIQLGQAKQSQEVSERVNAGFHEVYGADNPYTIASEIYVAEALRAQGEFARALEICSRVHDRLQEELGQTNPSTLRATSRLAACHRDLGHHTESRQLYENAWRLFSEQYGENHPDTLRTQFELTQALDQDGQVAESIQLATRTVEKMENVLGKHHPDTVSCWTFLAMKYQQKGDFQKALPLLEMARDHTDPELSPVLYAISLNNLAVAYCEQQRGAEVIAVAEKSLSVLREQVPENHPVMLKTKNSLAAGLEMTGQLNKAISLWEEVAAGWLSKLGAEHSDTLMAQNNLSFGYLQNNQPEKAIPILEAGLGILREKDRERTSIGVRLMRTLAAAYDDVSRVDLSIELYEQAIAVLKETMGEAHPETLSAIRNLGVLCYRYQRLDKSIPVFEEGFAIGQKHLGPKHPETLRFAGNLGINYVENADWDDAIRVLEPVEEASAKIPQLRFSNVALLEAYVAKNDRDRAIALADRIHKRFQQQYSSAPIELASRVNQIGEQLVLLGEWEKAESLLRDALIQFQINPETSDPRIFVTHLHLGRALLLGQRIEEAKTELNKSLVGLQGVLEEKPDPSLQKRLLSTIDSLIQIHEQQGNANEASRLKELRKKFE